MSVILTSGKKINIERSIEHPIDKDILKEANFSDLIIDFIFQNSTDNKVYCWALVPTSNVHPVIKYMQPGDYIFISQSSTPKLKDAGNFIYYGIVINSSYNNNLNKLLWGTRNEDKPEKRNFIIFIRHIKKIDYILSKKDVMAAIGKPTDMLEVAKLLTDEKADIFLKNFFSDIILNYKESLLRSTISNIDISEVAFDSIVKNNFNKNKELEIQNLIKFIYVQCSANIDYEIKEITYRNKAQTNHVNKTNFAEDNLTNSSKKVIGWIGEEVAYNTIINNVNLISSLLRINTDNIVEVEWFNKNINISKPDWIDNSINKGCDIKIKLKNLSEIKLEVKSSYDDTNQITLTGNELRAMKSSCKNDYFILLINKLSNLHKNKSPNMIFLNNFIKEVPGSYLKFSKSHTLYIKELVLKYKLTN